MLLQLSNWWKIHNATNSARKEQRYYRKRLAKANKVHLETQQMRDLEADASHFVNEAWIERDHVISRTLTEEASLLNVPVPDMQDPEMWYLDDMRYYYRPTLTNKGISALRKTIREERQARGMYAKIVFTAIVSSIGAIAAIIGAVAALMRVSK